MLLPLVVLTGINLIVLLCWAVIAPLDYKRMEHDGTDPWNRVISTYGTCVSPENVMPVYVLLVAINLGALIIANVQAYRARNIRTEYSESKYVAASVFVMAEAGVIAIPVLFLIDDQPRVKYVVGVLLVTVIAMAVLCFIFIPKFFPKATHQKACIYSEMCMVHRNTV